MKRKYNMFKKEAKEYVNEEYDFCYYPEDNLSTRINAERDWSKGAEFGYNKANEWHYPSKGEYPKEYENVLCCCEVIDTKFYSIGHTVIGGDNKIRWWSSNRAEEINVYAWKEITPPKEVEEK